jgi:hypothetical protein
MEDDRLKGPEVDGFDKKATSVLKCMKLKRSAEDRDAWRRRTEETKAQVGL